MNILYISYFYPPLGGPASLRNLKSVKYLTERGAKITLLTVGQIQYSYEDESLVQSSLAERIIRVPSWDPMSLLCRFSRGEGTSSEAIYKKSPERLKLFVRRLFMIDDKELWLPNLFMRAYRELKSEDYDMIYVSCGPFSSALVAWILGRIFGKKLVIDYRDYWTLLSDYDLFGSVLKRRLNRALERKILRSADFVVSATSGILDELISEFDPALPSRSYVLYNGHDEEDYSGLPFASPDEQYFTLSYFGALYARRSLKYLYQAVAKLEEENVSQKPIRIRLYGSFNHDAMREVEESGIADKIEIIPPMSHSEALFEMQKSDALILIINSSSPRGTLTSKVFEYLRLGVPILALVPKNNEAAELLVECGAKYIAAMESMSSIEACLKEMIGENPGRQEPSAQLAKYERRRQVGELFERLDELVSS